MSIESRLPVIHAFWHGPNLSRVEQLSLRSFLAHGHQVMLHTYEAPEGVPDGVQLVDASKTLPESAIFRYEGRERYANRGSIAGFADWFRYKLLHEEGGIWVDADMVCLRPFAFETETVFAWEDYGAINVAVLGLKAGDPLAKWMSDRCESPNKIVFYDTIPRIREKLRRRFLEGNKRGNVQFGEYGPKGLTLALDAFGRMHEALPPSTFYPVHYKDWKLLFTPSLGRKEVLGDAYGVHLWNEKLRQDPDFDKNGPFAPDSVFEQLWDEYCID